MRRHTAIVASAILAWLVGGYWVSAGGSSAGGKGPSPQSATERRILQLQERLALQQKQIDQLSAALEEQNGLLQQAVQFLTRPGAAEGREAALVRTAAAAVRQEGAPQAAGAVEALGKRLDEVSRNLGGFRFSGDFRLRTDMQLRAGNDVAGPLQNVRARYRLRLNLDKELDPKFRFHMQLSTGPANNGLTNDQDLAGLISKHPFSISEAYVDFHPHARFALRAGRMEEVFADNMRFLWDDDVRFNGFQQVLTFPLRAPFAGFKTMELRAGEYFLTNPNVVVLAPGSPFVSAGYIAGQKVRDAMLFHPGLSLKGNWGGVWSHALTADVQIYRNPDQIQLASLAVGFPVLVNPALGIALSGPAPGTGNATTSPGGALYSAPHFQIVRLAWRLEDSSVKVGASQVPFWLDIQAARNMGTSRLRDAVMVSASLGAVRERGNMRFLYQFAVKDANSLISQFTDDDLGTGSGVNIAVHALRLDIGLTRFLQWQNLFFMQRQRRTGNPLEQLFIPLQRGANTTYRYLGQLAFTF